VILFGEPGQQKEAAPKSDYLRVFRGLPMKRKLDSAVWASGAIVLVAGVLSAPVLIAGFPQTHDGWVHSRWSTYFAQQFWAGEWYPRWLMALNGGLGSPAFFYYPPLPHWSATLLQPLVPGDPQSWGALGISCGLALTLSGLFAFGWLRRFLPLWVAAAAAISYMLVPYHLLVDLYTRSAFAEFWGMTWLPLVIACAHGVGKGDRYSIPALAVAYALLVLSHLPTTLLFSLVPPAYVLVVAPSAQRRGALVRTVLGMALGTGLASVYLVPALTLQPAASMNELTRLYLYDKYFLLGEFDFQNFDLGRGTKPMVFWAVLSMVAAGVCSALLAWGDWDAERRRHALFWCGVAAVCAFMMTPPSKLVWEALPTLQIVQFPSRFGTVLSVATAALVALGLTALKAGLTSRRIALAQSLWALAVGWLYFTFLAAWPGFSEQIDGGSNSLLRDVPEYRPRWVQADLQSTLAKFKSEGDLTGKVAFARGEGSVLVEQWKPRNNVLLITVPAASTVLVRQYYYPGWTARVNGEPHEVQISEPDGLVQLSLPPGIHRIELRLERTQQELWGWIITWASLLIAAGVLMSQRFLKRRGSGVASEVAVGGGSLAAEPKRAE
jgi:hypothetical protein